MGPGGHLAAAIVMMTGSLCRTTATRAVRAASSSFGPAFVSLHRPAPGGRLLHHDHGHSSGAAAPRPGKTAPPRSCNLLLPGGGIRRGARSRTFLRSSSHDHASISFSTTTSTSTTADEDEPFTWPRLVHLFRNTKSEDEYGRHHISSDHPRLELFRRSAADQKKYEQHKVYLDENWVSVYDYLVCSKFGEEFGFDRALVRKDGADDGVGGGTVNMIEDVPPLPGEKANMVSNQLCVPPEGYLYKSELSLTEASEHAIEYELSYLKLVLNDFPYDVKGGIEHWCLWKIGGCNPAEGIVREELVWAVGELECLVADGKHGTGLIIDGSDPEAPLGARDALLVQRDRPERSEQSDKNTDGPVRVEDAFFWVNPPHLQSMPGIHHAHVLVKREAEENEEEGGAKKSEGTSPPPV